MSDKKLPVGVDFFATPHNMKFPVELPPVEAVPPASPWVDAPRLSDITPMPPGQRLRAAVLPRWPIGVPPAFRLLVQPSSVQPVEPILPVQPVEPPKLPGAPSVPAPRVGPAPIVKPPVQKVPKKGWGKLDVMAPIEGDEYRYPPLVKPPELPKAARFEIFLAAWLKEFLSDGEEDSTPRTPPQLPGGKKRLPLPGPESWLASEDFEALNNEFSQPFSEISPSPETATEKLRDRILNPKSNPMVMLDKYLKDNGIRYFGAHEVTRHRWRKVPEYKLLPGKSASWWFAYDFFEPKLQPDGIHFLLARHVIPPPWMWPNILPSLRVLDRFRHYLGAPVKGISGYRHPWYNRSIKGVDGEVDGQQVLSFHCDFAAMDFMFGQRNEHDRLATGVFTRFFQSRYRRKGDGVGRYKRKGSGDFMHLDVGLKRHLIPGKGLNWWRPKSAKEVMR